MALTLGWHDLGLRLADRYAVCDIEIEATLTVIDGARDGAWYDLAPMLDLERHPADVVALHEQTIVWAFGRRLIELHPERPTCVRVAQRFLAEERAR